MAIASIAVSIKARTAAFRADMQKAGQVVKRFGVTVLNVARRIARYTTIVTAAGITVATVFTKRQAEATDVLAKTADKLGLTTEALAGLRLAAKHSGVDIRKLDMGIQRMTRRIAEAAMDTGEAKAAIKELGLNARELVKLPLERQFAAIAERMARVSSQAHRVRLGFKLFDSEGVALINTLNLGSKELRRIEQDARRFGLAVSRIDAARVEQMHVAFVNLGASLRGLGRTLAIEVSGPIAVIANTLANKLPDLRMWLATKALPAIGRFAIRVLDIGEDIYDQIRRWIARIRLAFAEFAHDFVWLYAKLPGNTGRLFKEALPHMRVGLEAARARYAGVQSEIMGKEIFPELRISGKVRLALRNVIRDALKETFKLMGQRMSGILEPFQRFWRGDWLGMTERGPRLAQAAPEEAIARRHAEFQQISLARMYLPGLGAMRDKPQTVTDPQNKIISNQLDRLIWEMQNRGVTLAG